MIKTADSEMTLINLSLLQNQEIARLKKSGTNITVTFNLSDKKVKFLSAEYEPEK